MKRIAFFPTFALLLALLACNADRQAPATSASENDLEYAADEPLAQAAPAETPPPEAAGPTDPAKQPDPFSSLAAQPGPIDSVKKFIRTAEVRGRVRDVLRSTLVIEDVVARNGGFVTANQLSSTVEQQTRQAISPDSAVEITRFNVRNELTLRVPFTELDTTLRSIGRQIELLDLRVVAADDITLRLLSENLAQRRLSEHQQHLRSALQSKPNPNVVGQHADRLLASRAEADRQRLERFRLDDAVQYSTVKIALYQPAGLRMARVANTEAPPVHPPFAHRLAGAFTAGWWLLEGLVLVVVRLWSVWLLAGLAWWAWRVWGTKAGMRMLKSANN